VRYSRPTAAVCSATPLEEASPAAPGAIRRPIVIANSYALPEDPSSISWSSTDMLLYTRNPGANQLYLQEKLATLEGGEQAVVLASGVAALHAVFFTFLRTGAHVICSDVTYIAAYRRLHQYLPEKFGVEVSLVDTSDLDAVRAASARIPSWCMSRHLPTLRRG